MGIAHHGASAHFTSWDVKNHLDALSKLGGACSGNKQAAQAQSNNA
jgi:hypothetical protein